MRRPPDWILAPFAPYERTGNVPNVVFPCGLIHDAANGDVRVNYGAADNSICLAMHGSMTCSRPCSPPGQTLETVGGRRGFAIPGTGSSRKE